MKSFLPVVVLALCAACPTTTGTSTPEQDAGGNCGAGSARDDAGFCALAPEHTEVCNNGVADTQDKDDAGNQLVDCFHPSCKTDSACQRDGGTADSGPPCVPTVGVGRELAVLCQNGKDDDCNGLKDGLDPSCFNGAECRLDTDGDGINNCQDTAPNCFNKEQGCVVDCSAPPLPAPALDAGQQPDASVTVTLSCDQQVYHRPLSACTRTDGGQLLFADGGAVPSGAGINITQGTDGTCTGHFAGNLDSDVDPLTGAPAPDGIQNCVDNCVFVTNAKLPCTVNAGCVGSGGVCSGGFCSQQKDSDGDGVGSACEVAGHEGVTDTRPAGSDTDSDGDGLYGAADPCPYLPVILTTADDTADQDGDGILTCNDVCAFPNQSCQPERADAGVPVDSGQQQNCGHCPTGLPGDRDCDGVPDGEDNAPTVCNPPAVCGIPLTPACQVAGAACVNGRCNKQDLVAAVCNSVSHGSCDMRLVEFPVVNETVMNADGTFTNQDPYGIVVSNSDNCPGNTAQLLVSAPGVVSDYSLEMETDQNYGSNGYACVQAWAHFTPQQVPANSHCLFRMMARAEGSRTVRMGFVNAESPYPSLTTTPFNAGSYQEFALNTAPNAYYSTPPGFAPEGCAPGELCVEFLVNADNSSTRLLTIQAGNSDLDVQMDARELWCKPATCQQ